MEVLWCGPSASSLTTSCLPHCISRSEVESTRRRRIRHGECRHPLLTIATTDPGPHPTTTTTTTHPFSRALTVTVTPTVRWHRMGLDEGVAGCERSPAPRRGNSHTLEARASCAYASPTPRRTTVIVRRSASSISLPAVKRSVVATRSASIGTTLPPRKGVRTGTASLPNGRTTSTRSVQRDSPRAYSVAREWNSFRAQRRRYGASAGGGGSLVEFFTRARWLAPFSGLEVLMQESFAQSSQYLVNSEFEVRMRLDRQNDLFQELEAAADFESGRATVA